MRSCLPATLCLLLLAHPATAQDAKQEVLIDNDAVRVTRVTIPPGAVWVPPEARGKRVIIAITGNRTKRHAKVLDSEQDLPADRGETISRRPGDATYRTPSHHSITNLGGRAQVTDIVEIKR